VLLSDDPQRRGWRTEAAGELDVHLDGALELGAVGDDDPRGAQVAGDAGALVEGDGGDGDDVAVDLAVDVDAVDLDVGLDDGRLGDGEVTAEWMLPSTRPSMTRSSSPAMLPRMAIRGPMLQGAVVLTNGRRVAGRG
jgi:hypothetical protein